MQIDLIAGQNEESKMLILHSYVHPYVTEIKIPIDTFIDMLKYTNNSGLMPYVSLTYLLANYLKYSFSRIDIIMIHRFRYIKFILLKRLP